MSGPATGGATGGGGGSGNVQGLFHARGNATSVLNTGELMETVLKAERSSNEEYHVVQRFLKCRGPNAFIMRTAVQVYYRGGGRIDAGRISWCLD